MSPHGDSSGETPGDTGAALEIRGLVKRFRSPGLLGFGEPGPPAVDGVDLSVGYGEVVALIGESGSGKTTLVRAALGLIPFDSGEVSLLGRPLASMNRGELRRWRRRFQLLFQDPAAMLNPGLSVRQHLLESARLHRPDEDAEALAAAVAERVSISHRLRALPGELSGGEKRRVGLARLLVADPVLLVADEPTSGLDAALKADLIDQLLSRRGADRAFLLVSHDLPLMAYASDRVVVMYAGCVIEELPTDRLTHRHHHPYTASLLAASGLLQEVAPALPARPAGPGSPGCPHLGPCPISLPRCALERPTLSPPGAAHRIACHAVAPTPEEP